MRQLFLIHGGSTFDTNEDYLADLKSKHLDYMRLKPKTHWSYWLSEQLPEDDVLAPTMPNSQNAQYAEWKIMFEKLFPFFDDDVTLVGHSLGAIFLVKYLTENTLLKKLDKLIFVSAPYDDETQESLGGFKLSTVPDISPAVANEIHFMHARDDVVVPFAELAKYRETIDHAAFHEYETGNHFFGETFPELISIINKK